MKLTCYRAAFQIKAKHLWDEGFGVLKEQPLWCNPPSELLGERVCVSLVRSGCAGGFLLLCAPIAVLCRREETQASFTCGHKALQASKRCLVRKVCLKFLSWLIGNVWLTSTRKSGWLPVNRVELQVWIYPPLLHVSQAHTSNIWVQTSDFNSLTW